MMLNHKMQYTNKTFTFTYT